MHRFAVEPEVALAQRRLLGDENIGTRAAKLIAAFYSVVDAVRAVVSATGVDLPEQEIASPAKQDVEDRGWWTITELKSLGYRAPREMSRTDFLRRCVTVAILIERLHEGALRQVATGIGVSPKQVKELKTLGLLGVLAVVGELAKESGLRLSDAANELAARWNKDRRIPAVKVLFAGRELRTLASHATEKSAQQRVDQNLRDLGIDPDAQRNGWGTAVDQLYERMSAALEEIARLLREAC